MTKAYRLSAIASIAICLFALASPAAAQALSEAPKKGDIEVTQYDDWEVRCLQSANTCRMYQVVRGPETDKPIMRVVVGYPRQSDTAAMVFVLPLGIRLRPGVQVSIDGGEPLRVPFQICLDSGCRATLPVRTSLLNKFRNGLNAKVTFVGPRGQKVNLDVSLMGFTAASRAIAP